MAKNSLGNSVSTDSILFFPIAILGSLYIVKFIVYILAFVAFGIFFSDINVLISNAFTSESASTMASMGVVSQEMYQRFINYGVPLPHLGQNYLYFMYLSCFLTLIGKILSQLISNVHARHGKAEH